ncbi:unnamed protein product, partial [marine sediment metagenome]
MAVPGGFVEGLIVHIGTFCYQKLYYILTAMLGR